ncbi:PREDICTED: uncharacterized protein LOC104822452 [Tarenaya hassleriana]|uniref:uncharacterized protein LOC104822452 n=1 Tax=Tarenaya hassleriana TaxID=28532 RepID=UPI00053C270C|nr:PREDICTED: uncharacterized protein LOC104822452 [Tarenaya hassleriana]XP_010551988.1 PREDICTED: uncharacterized protein LOC104822452 [Tarenaya hassleriana]XP_010551989.1 PREDICTED: uncharacterized protein LOC104822452 [Tarenaya hassleriana]
MADSSSAPKRYTPPNQRNRSVNRKKSGDRLERSSSSQGNEGERIQVPATRNVAVRDHGDSVSNSNSARRIISVEGCHRSEAYQLLSERWEAAMNLYNNPTVDLSERPIMYYGGDVWGRLPHKIMASANNTGPPPTDYRSELRRGLLTPRTTSSNH